MALSLAVLLSVSPTGADPARADTTTRSHTCVVVWGGIVKCWGSNERGQLGDGTTTSRLTPVTVIGISTAIDVATTHAAGAHSCAVLAEGTVKCWGSNGQGQLGDGTTTDRLTPVTVAGISTATAVTVRGVRTCALLANHTVRCWGSGWLGDGTTTDSLVPIAVSEISTATFVSAGGDNTCARLASGTVKCWGSNSSGQLGDGTTTDSPMPVPVSGISTAIAVSAGSDHACALLAGGAVKCWGANFAGQLGDGTTTDRPTPVSVVGISAATAIDAGASHSCAILSSGIALCWGSNGGGELGDGTTTPRLTPVAVSGIATGNELIAGQMHTCASLTDGTVRCWGNNTYGQLGDGTTTTRLTPIVVFLPKTPFTDIAGSPFKPDIEWVYTAGITSGCTATAYCPSGYVTREQMASFLARALKLTGTAPDAFTDDEASPHEPNINLVAKAGIATGCSATKYCPTALVSREQMASFLARALKLAGSAPDAFTDDEQSIHEPNINLVAKAGVATGCGAGKYCPTANVTRGQMAAFLHRAFGP